MPRKSNTKSWFLTIQRSTPPWELTAAWNLTWLQSFSVKVRGEISFHFFKTAKRSIRALAWCTKHILAWRGSDHIWEKEPTVVLRHRGKMRVMWREGVAPGNNSSSYRQYFTCSPCFLMSTKKCFYFCSTCSTMSCYSCLIRQPMHPEIAAYVLTEMARQERICRFAFLCILKCVTFTGITGHAASLSSGVRQSSHTGHWRCRREEQHGSHTSLMLKETKDELFLILDATFKTGRVGSVLPCRLNFKLNEGL